MVGISFLVVRLCVVNGVANPRCSVTPIRNPPHRPRMPRRSSAVGSGVGLDFRLRRQQILTRRRRSQIRLPIFTTAAAFILVGLVISFCGPSAVRLLGTVLSTLGLSMAKGIVYHGNKTAVWVLSVATWITFSMFAAGAALASVLGPVEYAIFSTAAMASISSCLVSYWPHRGATWRIDRLWLILGVWHLRNAVMVSIILGQSFLCDEATAGEVEVVLLFLAGPVELALAFTSLRPMVRVRLRAWLSAVAERTDAAIKISMLLGEVPQGNLRQLAAERFRYVSADRIAYEPFMSSARDPSLRSLTEPARYGEVDVFLSHSWHDDPFRKWKLFQEWREEFRRRHAREREGRRGQCDACAPHSLALRSRSSRVVGQVVH